MPQFSDGQARQTRKCGLNRARERPRPSVRGYLQPCCVITAQVHSQRKLHTAGKRSNKQTARRGESGGKSTASVHLLKTRRANTPFLFFSLPPLPPLFLPPPLSPSHPHFEIISLPPPPSLSHAQLQDVCQLSIKKGTTYLDGSQGCPPGCTCFCFHLP